MKRPDLKFFILLAATLSAMVSGCGRDNLDSGGPETPAGAIRIPFTIDGMRPGTRAATTETEEGERRLEDVHVLFFDAAGTYITFAPARVWSGTSSFTLTVPDDIHAGTAYKTLIVGNANSYAPEDYNTLDAWLTSQPFEEAVYDYDELCRQLHARQKSAAIRKDDGLPMWGELQDGSGAPRDFEFIQLADGLKQFTGSVKFARSVCRLDLKNADPAELIIEKVRVCNYRSSGYYFKDDPRGDRSAGLDDNAEAWIPMPAPAGNAQELTAAVYTFPNYSEEAENDDLETTYLMIAGYYQDGTDNTAAEPRKKLTYYRFNMATPGTEQQLLRNRLYRGTITSVKGAGSDNEDGAATSKESMLSYSVEDTWDDGDSNTATDADGNFLTVSRSTLTFDGSKGVTKTVQVKGNSWDWDCEWLSGGEFFAYSRTDGETLSITTLAENATGSAHTGILRITSSADSQLSLTLTVIQLSGSEQTQMLLVDGQVGRVEITMPGEGGTTELLVQTGTSDGLWKVSTDDMGTVWSGWGCTPMGGNNSYLTISVPANLSDMERTGEIKVYRVTAGGDPMDEEEVSPVIVHITQPASRFVMSVTPTFSGNTLSIDAFDDSAANPDGISWQKQIFVSLADPSQYKWNVTSTFHAGYDLILSKNLALPLSTKASAAFTDSNDDLTGIHGESFWINVFRTAPGDPDIRGTISISAVDNANKVKQTLTLSVTITTNCVIDDIQLGSLIFADRNVGTARRWNDAYATVFYPARNYTNDPKVKISGFGSDYVSDMVTNAAFKGSYSTWTEATGTAGYPIDSRTCAYFAAQNVNDNSTYYKDADKGKWRLPTNSELITVNGRLRHSKSRVFIVSDKPDVQGHKVGCFFPLSGHSGTPADVLGYYWSSVTYNSNSAYYLYVTPSSSIVNFNNKTYGFSVRCVRPV